jgi:hypothetical protein
MRCQHEQHHCGASPAQCSSSLPVIEPGLLTTRLNGWWISLTQAQLSQFYHRYRSRDQQRTLPVLLFTLVVCFTDRRASVGTFTSRQRHKATPGPRLAGQSQPGPTNESFYPRPGSSSRTSGFGWRAIFDKQAMFSWRLVYPLAKIRSPDPLEPCPAELVRSMFLDSKQLMTARLNLSYHLAVGSAQNCIKTILRATNKPTLICPSPEKRQALELTGRSTRLQDMRPLSKGDLLDSRPYLRWLTFRAHFQDPSRKPTTDWPASSLVVA